MRPKLLLVTVALIGQLVFAGCATNPATGRQDFVLMSEQDELSLGRQYHPKIIKKYGRYENETLQRYVQEIGEDLAKTSDRSELIYRFTVLDSPQVNAFALPGGYIYITRGLMAYLNSEAQLAAVLGHELGHVTARHSVRQHSTSTTVGILGAVLASASGVAGAGNLADAVGTAIVRGYGRDMELEADGLGSEYLARAGYRPEAMLEVVRVLKDQELFERQRAKEEGREPRVYHGLFSTHPDNDTRLREVIRSGSRFQRSGAIREDGVTSYLRKLDGLVFGDGRKEGIVRGNRFFHEEMGFALEFPRGWRIENRSDRLEARTVKGDARLRLFAQDINKRMPPKRFIEERLKLDDLKEGRVLSLSGLDGYTALADLPIRKHHPLGRVAVVYLHHRAFAFVGTVKDKKDLERYDSDFVAAVDSFHKLSSNELPLAQPLRLRIRRVAAGEKIAGLARGSRIPNHPDAQLRLINGLYPKGEPSKGKLIKVVD